MPAIPTGSELVVHQQLPLQAGAASVFVQGGEIVAEDETDRFRVACAIVLQRRGDESLADAVEPGQFVVIEGSRSWTRNWPRDDDDSFINPPTRLDYFTEMEIRSDLQPQVDELRCRYRGYRIQDDAPGPEEIRKTFGELGSLQLPGRESSSTRN